MSDSKTILVVIPVSETHRAYLENIAENCKTSCSFRYTDYDKVTAEEVREADAVIGNVDPKFLKGADKLEWLQLNTAGADQFCKEGVLPSQTVLTNSTGAYGLSVSEHMVSLTFALIRRLPQYVRNQTVHSWVPAGDIISAEGSRILTLGLGDIGGSYARKMKAMGAYTIGVRRTEAPKPDYLDEQYTIGELDRLLPEADIVAMVLPGGDQTYHLMDERRLRLMKKGAYLINVGRGTSVDPDGLHKVLKEGLLGGCALDVTEPEPLPKDDPLWDMDNVLITPHVAGQFYLEETFERVVKIAGENLEAWLTGKALKNQIDIKTGYVRK